MPAAFGRYAAKNVSGRLASSKRATSHNSLAKRKSPPAIEDSMHSRQRMASTWLPHRQSVCISKAEGNPATSELPSKRCCFPEFQAAMMWPSLADTVQGRKFYRQSKTGKPGPTGLENIPNFCRLPLTPGPNPPSYDLREPLRPHPANGCQDFRSMQIREVDRRQELPRISLETKIRAAPIPRGDNRRSA